MILGRKNYLFCQGHKSADRTAIIYSLIASCKLNNIDPATYLEDVMSRIKDMKIQELSSILPNNWKPLQKKQRILKKN